MSELINNTSERMNEICNFTQRLLNGENGKRLIEEFQPHINNVDAAEAMQVFDHLLQHNSFEKVKSAVGKIINVFYKSLDSLEWEKPGEGHFLFYLMLENRQVEKVIADVRPAIKEIFNKDNTDDTAAFNQLRTFISRVKEYELHYVKKEIILFPYLEKCFSQHKCLQLMWSFHDDFRRSVKAIDNILSAPNPDKSILNPELGKLFFVIMPIIFREEQIIFPVALRAIPQQGWAEMLEQSKDVGWSYAVTPRYGHQSTVMDNISGLVDLNTGYLKPEQIALLLNNLPVDITFVDENDEVRYFSGAKHRIFHRSKAIIGRKVQNCHPHESVHVVNEIVEAFKAGSKDHADFWIQMKGMFVHIRYFALRDEQGNYKGTIEVSQDVTEIRALQGNRRLLDWDNPDRT